MCKNEGSFTHLAEYLAVLRVYFQTWILVRSETNNCWAAQDANANTATANVFFMTTLHKREGSTSDDCFIILILILSWLQLSERWDPASCRSCFHPDEQLRVFRSRRDGSKGIRRHRDERLCRRARLPSLQDEAWPLVPHEALKKIIKLKSIKPTPLQP